MLRTMYSETIDESSFIEEIKEFEQKLNEEKIEIEQKINNEKLRVKNQMTKGIKKFILIVLASFVIGSIIGYLSQ